jgi:hypothetical protein
MSDSKQPAFDPHAFLLNAGLGKRLVHLKAKEAFFLQGDVTDSVFYLQKGRGSERRPSEHAAGRFEFGEAYEETALLGAALTARVPVLTSLPPGWRLDCEPARTGLNKLKNMVPVGQKEQSSDRDSWHALRRFLGDPVASAPKATPTIPDSPRSMRPRTPMMGEGQHKQT